MNTKNPYLKQVAEFHKAFKQPILEEPGIPSRDRQLLRAKLLAEEAEEAEEELASLMPNLRHIAKELADVLYVAYGTILEYGLQDVMDDIFAEVHRSNMSKLENGKPVFREDGKAIKGKYYTPANLRDIL